MTTITTPPVDVWGHTPALRTAQDILTAASATGNATAIAAAARALIIAAAVHAWPTASALIYKREATGRFSGVWALWCVVDAEQRILRLWEDDPDSMSDETEAELVAVDLISNRRETQDYADFGTLPPSANRGFHTLLL